LTVVFVAHLASLALSASIGANAAEWAACPAHTALTGDANLVAAVGSALRQRGINNGRPVGCSPLRVAIGRRESGLKLELRGPAGEVTERVVAAPDTAAVLIESWLRTDIAAPLLAARAPEDLAPPPALPAPELAALPAATDPAPLAAVAAPVVTARPSPGAGGGTGLAGMTILGEGALVRGGSRELGASLGSCLNLRRFCLGVTARLAHLSPVSPDDQIARSLDHANGYAADGLLAADYALRAGRATFRPGVGAGLGWVWTRGMIAEHGASFDAVGPRAEGRLAIDLAIARALALELQMAAGAAATATFDRVPSSRDKPMFVSDLAPVVRAGLGLRIGGGP
jgi:hypothetical protein